MKKIVIILFTLILAGCIGEFQKIKGYKNIQKHSEKWCKIGCVIGIKNKNKAVNCINKCVELSVKDVRYRKFKYCHCNLTEF